MEAAADLFCAHGYDAVSVEDIAARGGVSRMTFYRQFSGKADLAAALFEDSIVAAMPRLLSIRDADWRNRAAVGAWIAALFENDRAHRAMLRVFTQASVHEPTFLSAGHAFIERVMAELGRAIPVFAADRDSDRRQWLEAWLLIYELFDQSNHAALSSGIATDPLVQDILADRFLRFVARES